VRRRQRPQYVPPPDGAAADALVLPGSVDAEDGNAGADDDEEVGVDIGGEEVIPPDLPGPVGGGGVFGEQGLEGVALSHDVR